MSRKTKYDPDTFPLLAEGYAREGLNDEQIAERLGISHDSYYRYQRKYSEFFEAVKRGKRPVDFEVENSLLKRANGFRYEEKTTELRIDKQGNAVPAVVKRVEKEMPPETKAIALWLKNRKPEKWREKQEVEISTHPFLAKIEDESPEEE